MVIKWCPITVSLNRGSDAGGHHRRLDDPVRDVLRKDANGLARIFIRITVGVSLLWGAAEPFAADVRLCWKNNVLIGLLYGPHIWWIRYDCQYAHVRLQPRKGDIGGFSGCVTSLHKMVVALWR